MFSCRLVVSPLHPCVAVASGTFTLCHNQYSLHARTASRSTISRRGLHPDGSVSFCKRHVPDKSSASTPSRMREKGRAQAHQCSIGSERELLHICPSRYRNQSIVQQPAMTLLLTPLSAHHRLTMMKPTDNISATAHAIKQTYTNQRTFQSLAISSPAALLSPAERPLALYLPATSTVHSCPRRLFLRASLCVLLLTFDMVAQLVLHPRRDGDGITASQLPHSLLVQRAGRSVLVDEVHQLAVACHSTRAAAGISVTSSHCQHRAVEAIEEASLPSK